LVVILPPHGLTKEQAGAESQLAEALAEREAVAVVANWTQLDEPDASFTDIDVLAKLAKAGQSMAACAVAFAVEHAEDYGADPTRLVIVGEIYGANAAAVVALTHPAPLTSCKADAVPQPIAVVALDADWYAAMPEWDQLGKDVHQAVDLLAPWSGLNAVSNVRVAATVATGTHDITNRCGGPEAPWLVDRDPTGQLRKRLDTVGALTDGCIDLLDQAQAATNQLAAAGLTARVIQLANTDSKTGLDPGGHHHIRRRGPSSVDASNRRRGGGVSASPPRHHVRIPYDHPELPRCERVTTSGRVPLRAVPHAVFCELHRASRRVASRSSQSCVWRGSLR